MSKKHALLSPSSSKQWLKCPLSITLIKQFPPKEETSVFAAEGTSAHELGEMALLMGVDPNKYLGHKIGDFVVDEAMIEAVNIYVDYVVSLGGTYETEIKVKINDEVYGTCDTTVVCGNTLHVIDLKYGKGVEVFAENNTQAMIYALGALKKFDNTNITEVVCTIVQPRIFGDRIKTFNISAEDLINWGKQELETGCKKALDDSCLDFEIGEWCKFCKTKAHCQGMKDKTMEITRQDFASVINKKEIVLPNITTLSGTELGRIMEFADLVEGWFKAIKETATDKIHNGEPITGYKLVKGRNNRSWANKDKAEQIYSELLGKKAYETKFRSVAQIEKELKKSKEIIQDGLVNISCNPVMAKESDKRKAITSSAEIDFAEFIKK